MKDVLVISYFYPPCADGGVVRVNSFSRHLPANGWRPIILTVKEDFYPSFTRDESLANELSSDLLIYRTSSLEPKGSITKGLTESVYGIRKTSRWFEKFGKGFLRTVYRSFAIPDEHILWLPSAVTAGMSIIQKHNIRAIFVTSPPHSVGLIGLLLSYLSGKPLIWDVRDDWVGNPLFDVGPWHRHRIANMLESLLVQKSTRVVSVTKESVEAFESKYPKQAKDKYVFIPNGYDGEELSYVNDTPVSPVNPDKMRIVYTGTLGRTRTPVALLHAIQDLAQSSYVRSKLQVDFYGYSRAEFAEISTSLGLDDIVSFHGFVPRHESLLAINTANVALMIIPEEEGSRTAIPGKLYEYLGLKKPVLALCSSLSAAGKLVVKEGLGLVIPQDDTAAIKSALVQMFELYEAGKLKVSISDVSWSSYDRAAHAKALSKVLTEVSK